MSKILILSLFLTIGFTSCKNSEKEVDKIEIAKSYYDNLNNSDYSGTTELFSDSLTTKEGKYITNYSKSVYVELLKWDFVFSPSHEILEIEQQDGIVKAKISKRCKRILFLHEKPFITNQIIRFEKNKIVTIETDYTNFDEKTWERNKTGLINWIDENNPELSGSINDLTESGGIKLLKAIELYENKK